MHRRCFRGIFLIMVIANLANSFSPASAQQISETTILSDSVLETSGLIFLDGRLITHNDSGDGAKLYEIDTLTGDVLRTVFIRNAPHRDWEDICNDDEYIYIGDFGNNWGNRHDLRIYRLPIDEYLKCENDSVDVEVINFSYADQRDFKPAPILTNYDTEAVIAYNDSLYIFTKNWGDNYTCIYSCPKDPGTYKLSRIDEVNTKGLVTGASYNSEKQSIILSGYIHSFPFLVEIKSFEGNHFSDGEITRYILPKNGSTQIEGITSVYPNRYFLSSEQTKKGKSSLYSFSDQDLAKMKPRKKQLGPTALISVATGLKSSFLFRLFWKTLLFFYL